MPLFQSSIVKKYINDIDLRKLDSQWAIFKNHFLNPEIQKNIQNLKEEEYQEGFIRDLFVKVLGYTLNPQPGYDFVLEKKSVTDATKSDGAILLDGKIIAVVELKDTSTTDLGKVTGQAFGYKHKHKNCLFVIVSNFEKLRFYIHDSTEFEEFNLFTLDKAKFALLFICLEKNFLARGVPVQIKNYSTIHEEKVTNSLYEDYSVFKRKLFQSIITLSPDYDKLTLFKKTQKLLDRFLFILFAEDRLLIPPNSSEDIIKQWDELKNKYDEYFPLYDRFKKYFGYLNKGHIGKSHQIFAYNGGLFAPDEILDAIRIDDQVLMEGIPLLSKYDFETDVDVNILGHIFEHSLTEIEELQNELQGKSIDRDKSKRKKDGVFYTPRYITNYMIETTVGNACSQKKQELRINERSFEPVKRKNNRKKLNDILDTYRSWLLGLTICDPACGSGAFLNAALDFLIAEHKMIDELKANLFGASIVYSEYENSILEHNLYGVDINEDAVEIAKLSLWLRTAKKGRKLNNLSDNLKCGNSIIAEAIAGDKAFTWTYEFAHIFAKGGFDIIIGNPPYVDIKKLPPTIVEHLFANYSSANNRINLFAIFIEKALSLLKEEGQFSFIIPSSILTQESYKKLRLKLLEQVQITNIVRLPNESFGGSAGEVKVDTVIVSFKNTVPAQNEIQVVVYKGFDRINEIIPPLADFNFKVLQSNWFNDANHVFRINGNESANDVITKLEVGTVKFIDCAEFCLGLTPYDKYRGHTPDQITNRVFHATTKKDDTYQKLLAGNDITRYHVSWNGEEWICYGNWLGAARERRFFQDKRILVKQIIDWTDKRIWAAITEDELYNTQNAFNIIPKTGYLAEYLIAVLNSRLMTFYLKKKFLEEYQDRFQKILIKDCKLLPIKNIDEIDQLPFVQQVGIITQKTNEFNKQRASFIKFLQSRFPGVVINKKLENWQKTTFNEFLKELTKQKIILKLSEQDEWLDYLEKKQDIMTKLQNEISLIDNHIEQLVNRLYGVEASDLN
jgi:hypothetical protein